MNCWDKFDFIGVSAFTGQLDRMPGLKAELKRVGLSERELTWFWGTPSPYDDFLAQHLPVKRILATRIAYLSLTLAHLRMVKTAYKLGAEHALFIENDIRFLNDLELLEQVVDGVPDGYDIALFDWVLRINWREGDVDIEGGAFPDEVNWVPFKDLRSCALYALSRRGMAAFVAAMENPARGLGKLKICDQYWPFIIADYGLKAYAAYPLACVQGVGGGASDHDSMWERYGVFGTKREDYHA